MSQTVRGFTVLVKGRPDVTPESWRTWADYPPSAFAPSLRRMVARGELRIQAVAIDQIG